MALTSGSRLGPYEIAAAIGAGGMGEVYRARDTRLNRDVAIKVLPAGFASDPDRRARFEREAQAIAALSHPNILAIFDTGLYEGHLFVVTELLEGETLRDRLKQGALPVRKTIEYGVQIARGLGAAHDKGVVHRDLKPENVFVLKDGQVKILDFGLARVTTPGSGATETAVAITDPGTVMGTVGYMAPEQVRGQATDARADLFAFGAVLYEMLSGRRAFERDTTADTMTALLKEDPPDLAAGRSDLSPALDRIVRHCLEKSAVERFQTARDIAFALEAFSGSHVSSGALPALPTQRGWRRPTLLAVAALALIGLTAAAVRWLWPTPPAPTWTGVRLGGPEIAMGPRISPDGSTLAFQAMVGENTQVAVMKPGSGDWTILTRNNTAGYVVEMSWSPDGNTIYFSRTSGDVASGVFSVPVLGGDERLVVEGAAAPTALPDGSLLVSRLNAEHKYRLCRFWPDSNRFQEFPIDPGVGAGSYVYRAHVLPDGETAVILGTLVSRTQSEGVHLYVLDLKSGLLRRLPTGLPDDLIADIAVTRDGQTILASAASGNLVRIVAIARNGPTAARTLFTLTASVGFGMDVGPDGSIYAGQADSPLVMVRFPTGGGHAEKVVVPPTSDQDSGILGATVLSDGRIVVGGASPGGRRRLMIAESGKPPRALILTAEETAGPITTVGRSDVAFLVGPEPRRTIAVAEIATGRIVRRFPFDKGQITSLAASPNGETLYVAAGGTIWSVASSGGGESRKIRAGNSAAMDPSGQHLFVQVIETPKTRLFDVPLNGGPEREVPLNGPFHLTFDPLNSASFTPDGRLLMPLASPDNWFFPPGIVDLTTGKMTRIPVDHFGDYHVVLRTPDGQVIAGAFDLRSALWRFQPEGR